METKSKIAEIQHNFTYHPPKEGQQDTYSFLRKRGLDFSLDIFALTPSSREQSLALTKLEEAVMWANAAIARHG